MANSSSASEVNSSSATPVESKVDVLIIGAGPAGVMAANALAMAGVDVRIVDKRPTKVMAGQADGIQPRTIESYGLADTLLEDAAQLHMAAFYNPGPDGGLECTGRAPDITPTNARFPFEAILHQGEIERMFLESMEKHNCRVERPVVPKILEITADEKRLRDAEDYAVMVSGDFVKLQRLAPQPGEPETEIVHAKFVIGTDGAHSWTRKSLQIPMLGSQTEYIWGVLDIHPSTDFPDVRNRCAIHTLSGSCMIIPRERDKIRLYIQLTDVDVRDPESGRVDLGRFGPAQLLEVAARSFKPYRMEVKDGDMEKGVEWWALYSIGQRVAERYSVSDRVFIAGDACHTHSPKAGQGMNASMNDTHNLVWKITHVLRGWADISVLKTYEFERRKYAQDLIDFDKKFSKLFSIKPKIEDVVADGEDLVEGVTHAEFFEAFQTYGLFTSGIGVHYAPSAITSPTHQHLASNLIIGERLIPQIVLRGADRRPFEIQDLCPSDSRFKILVFAGLGEPVAPGAANAKGTRAKVQAERTYGRARKGTEMFDVLVVCMGKKETFVHTAVPEVFRPHWSKVLLDDSSAKKQIGGDMYKNYGIGDEGAVVVVRPDGYVGTVVPLEGAMEDLNKYFAAFVRRG
ncbi:uncharacterized protein STEHIDRAFT_68295 [Stereum hirsutum FP-91666 SS1]|uniref:FAD binding domain-containing protein n=1 Tax=Stereum hirsutum (strain FP-91666) TaxID=721885 RepID=R7RZS7_STEHR|nr:uncharacterized protein STEHIDRAFT_68295 [Stereum hirsutum FP-91666 SS1]EIM80353.1 hypothetical protein STEHIDRAFT_68295 [Stereum hirsutum FP-91666 SS1]